MRAGLDIVDAMAELNAAVPRPSGVELAVRIGIATGPVIVGDQIGEGTASETAVVGETPNLAARLQVLAQANQIVVSAATRAMLGDHFDLEDLGAYGQLRNGPPGASPRMRVTAWSGSKRTCDQTVIKDRQHHTIGAQGHPLLSSVSRNARARRYAAPLLRQIQEWFFQLHVIWITLPGQRGTYIQRA